MLSPEVRRAKIDGVLLEAREARMECSRKLEKCVARIKALQEGCPHSVNHEVPTRKGVTVRCMACDYPLDDLPHN